MHPLYQRLKELDSDTFEKFCFHLLKERHPGVDIRHVDGSAGDDGVDAFLGELDIGSVIWQCKSFPNGVRDKQKDQIREALNRVLAQCSPKKWVLCLSVDMDVKAHRWFQRLVKSNTNRVEIGLMQASDVVHEMIHRTSLRNTFFPDAILDIMELRGVLAKTGELTIDELAAVTAENVEQYLQRLKDRDARFAYEVLFSADLSPASNVQTNRPGLIASVSDKKKTINIFARDTEALRVNPPKGSFRLKGQGVEKLKDFLSTGRSQRFGPDELVSFTSDFAFITPYQEEQGNLTLTINQVFSATPKVPVRMTFGSGTNAVIYDWIEFQTSRAGSTEMELVSLPGPPFSVSIVLRPQGEGSLSFTDHFDGADVHEIQKFFRAINAAMNSGTLEFYDLKRGKALLRATTTLELPKWFGPYEAVINDVVAISDYYNVTLKVPGQLSPDDLASIALLKGLIEGTPVPFNEITLGMIKSVEPTPEMEQQLNAESSFIFQQQELFGCPIVFGTPVPTGPIEILVERARIKNAAEFWKFLTEAALGESADLILQPTGPMRARAIRSTPETGSGRATNTG
jgi:hypothetical protein